MRYRVVLFDLDGTLTDPGEGITRCVQYALACQGVRVDELAQLECFIGPPLKQSFIDRYGLDAASAEQALRDYRERFGTVGIYENAVYPGMVALLDGLKRDGRRLFVATSKPGFYARRIVAHFGLDAYFDDVYGSELDGTRTDKQALIAYILRQQACKPSEALMIGDRQFDLVGARGNGVASAAVGYGYGSREELLAQSPDYFFATLGDLYAALREARV